MRRRLVLLGVLVIGLLVIAWLGRSQLSLETLAQREESLRQTIDRWPVRWWLAGFVLYVLMSLVPGTRGKAIVCGWLFGFWPALLLVNFALTAAALLSFFLSRYLLTELVSQRYEPQLIWANRLLEREGAWYVLLLRIVPVSFSLTNYLLGATALRPRTFWWATQVGILPGNIAFVFVGAGLPSLESVAENGVWAFLSWELVVGLLLLSIFPLVVHRLVQRWRGQPLTFGSAQSPRV